MNIKRQINVFVVVSGIAMAISMLTHERFDLQCPAVFYGFNGLFILAVSAVLVKARYRKQISTLTVSRATLTLVLFYAIAATRSAIGPVAIFVAAMVVICSWIYANPQAFPPGSNPRRKPRC